MQIPLYPILFLFSASSMAAGPFLARPDIEIQGEYRGKIRSSGSESVIAAQVIAMGGGKFRVVFFPGGLPGAGFTGAGKLEAEAETTAGTVRISGDWNGTIDGDSLRGGMASGATFALAKTNRASPTLGLKPPVEAMVLFDGSSVAAWKNAVKDSAGNFTPLQREATTLRTFSDFSLHLEFLLPFMPDLVGQSRANSGLRFFNDNPGVVEMQILDSFGGDPGTEECGGIEGLYPPYVMAAFPPMAWQTLDVRMTTPSPADTPTIGKAKLTIWQNGILIHYGRELEYMGSGVNISLQNFTAPGAFRNIWIVEGDDAYPFPGVGVRPVRPLRADGGRRGLSRALGNSVRIQGPVGSYRADGREGF